MSCPAAFWVIRRFKPIWIKSGYFTLHSKHLHARCYTFENGAVIRQKWLRMWCFSRCTLYAARLRAARCTLTSNIRTIRIFECGSNVKSQNGKNTTMSHQWKESGPKWSVQKGENGRSVQKWTVLSQTGRSRTIVDGLLSQSGGSRVKVDGHCRRTKSRRLKVDGPLG